MPATLRFIPVASSGSAIPIALVMGVHLVKVDRDPVGCMASAVCFEDGLSTAMWREGREIHGDFFGHAFSSLKMGSK